MKNTFLKPTNPLLRKVAQKVPQKDISSKQLKDIIQKMINISLGEQKDFEKPIMVGLAAPQIGISKRIILVDTKADGKGSAGEMKVFLNPEIIWFSKKQSVWYEGCYSIPNICGIVKRSHSVKVKTTTQDGDLKILKATGYLARIFQHEVDHLYGTFFIDLIENHRHIHKVLPEEFSIYRNKSQWKKWPKKASLPIAYSRLKQV